MTTIIDNPTFYPTPARLADRMLNLVKWEAKTILDGQAGAGDLLEAAGKKFRHRTYSFAIEKDPNLRAILQAKNIPVIDEDFLTFSGPDKFDLIIGNPPFNDGDKHLLKAIDMLYSGQIIYLLNAETIRNPHTNIRKMLQKKLTELNAEIEFIENAFMVPDAKRKTAVEVALINIRVKREVETDLFDGIEAAKPINTDEINQDNYEVATKDTIGNMVAEYNRIINTGIETYISFFRNYRVIGKYIGIDSEVKHYSDDSLTDKMKSCVNSFAQKVRKDFWHKALNLDAITRRLTNKQSSLFHQNLDFQTHMDFTEKNIRQFILNVINGYDRHLYDAVVSLFDKMSCDYAWDKELHNGNVHYFNGWKSNNAFKVNKRIVFPIYAGYDGGPFRGYHGWELNWEAERIIHEFDLVMNYFDGSYGYWGLTNAIKKSFAKGINTKIESTYFTANCYKKGTIHLTFNSDDILRRFNICACKEKGWLPYDYAKKHYNEMDKEERDVVLAFEDNIMDYHIGVGIPDFSCKPEVKLLEIK
jgi:predicted RNA methylase